LITLVEVRTPQGDLLSLPLGDISGGYSVQEVAGLDPVKATIVSSAFASTDGEQYQSSRRESRNITMKLGIETDYVTNSVRSLRKKLYGYFLPKSVVNLRFYDDDDFVVNIEGRVESCETSLFSEETVTDISILCFDPDFLDNNLSVLPGSTVSSTVETLIDYEGEIETGFVFTLNINRTLTEFTLYNRGEDNIVQSFDVQASFVAGDIVSISTVFGNKYVTLTRSGTTSSLLYAQSGSWLELMPGSNHFRAYATGAAIPYSLSYVARYGGL
jgi:Siphovirus-type tail component, C-terminal domain/Phage tail protein RIFT-related domain